MKTMRRPGIFSGPTGAALAILTAINFFDQTDSAAFTVLAPDIKEDFGLTNAGITAIAIANLVLSTLFVVVIGFFADRMSRKRLVIWSAFAAAILSFSTGLVTSLLLLVFVRFANGVGRLVNDPVHTSLLTDYYPGEERPKAISVHRASEQIGGIVAPFAAGGIAALLSWRWAFMATAVPAFAVAFLAYRLREPLRGASEDAVAAEQAAADEPMPLGRAYRVLYNVRTLRRIWLANFLGGAALLPLATTFALYWDEVWGYEAGARGALTGVSNAAGLAGVLAAGPITARMIHRSPKYAQLFAGLVLAANAALLLVLAASPVAWLALAAFMVIQFGFGLWVPAAIGVASLVIPARIRSQGLSYTPLFMTLGAVCAFPLAGISDVHGHRWALFAFAPAVVGAGLVYASAYRFVDGDAERARLALEAEATLVAQAAEQGAGRSLLLARNLDVSYGTVPVLHQVDLDVREGEILALLGTNGAGKSTLLRAIAGLVHPHNGVVFFDGRDITFHEPEETAAEGIVLAPGGAATFPDMTVRDSLLAACWPLRRDPDAVRTRIDDALAVFPKLGERLDQVANTMSGGEQQMLALAQALVTNPRLLMIDELTLGLAPKVVSELLDCVREIHRRGVTIVLVEQSVNVALNLAERAYFLERGRVRFEGPTAELLERTDILRSVFLRPDVIGDAR